MTRQVRFGEDINKLVNRGDGKQLEIAFLEMLASDVAVNLNVLGVFVVLLRIGCSVALCLCFRSWMSRTMISESCRDCGRDDGDSLLSVTTG